MCLENGWPTVDDERTYREIRKELRKHTGQHEGCFRCQQYWRRVDVLCDEHGYSRDTAAKVAATHEGLSLVSGW